jgi:phosphate transport system protein
MERILDVHIEKLRKRLIKMCSLVDEQVDLSIKAIEDENLELANEVIERDKKVDKYDVKIEKMCQKIFALNQPVAMDLRLIMSAITMDTNLERIGDIAVNMAEHYIEMDKKPSFFNKTKFDEMAELSRFMIKYSIDAFVDGSAELAKKVIESDDKMDNLYADNRKLLIEIMKEDKENIEPAIALLGISRQMERLGDLTTNIAEDVYFIVEAQVIKHKYEKYLFSDDDEGNNSEN